LQDLILAKVDARFRNEKCVALVASTSGLSIDLAGALDVHAQDSRLTRANTSLAGYALWAEIAYDTDNFSVVALSRFAARKEAMGTEPVLDLGARSIVKAKTYAVSAEALLRRRFLAPGETTYKIDAAFEYEVGGDTWLSITFGKDFALAAESGSWFSLAHVQWSLGKLGF
jgi:hypothetical protein